MQIQSETASSADAPGLAEAYRRLSEVWGYDSFRPLQEEAVTDVITGRDSLVVLPTGGGKSMCYQVPALVRGGLAVVVSPLISLMKDQVDSLVSNGVAAALVNSTQSDEQKLETAQRIRAGEVRLLYLAPERLLTGRTLDFLSKQSISFFAIDEAHCVSNWGHDFRPEYRGLRVLRERFPDASIHAFTATASRRVRDDIVEQLTLRQPNVLVGNFDRPNLTYRMFRSDNRASQITGVIAKHPGESGVVYCITRKEVEQTAAMLGANGVSCLPYHAGLDVAERKSNQDAFIQEQVDVIVATVAFGMGIDKSNVRYVIHAGMPKSIEHYQQESGRAGRDGLPAECVLIYSGSDVMTWKRILENGDTANFESAMASVNAMADLCVGVRCRHAAIVDYFGQEYDADNCGACDVCLGELDLVEDSLVLAQKILSCTVRLKERFGAAYTVKVLNGAKDQKVIDNGHDQLSTYNLLGNEPAAAIRTWIDQLISQDCLRRVGEYNTLQLTAGGREILKGNGSVQLTKYQKRARAASQPSEESWDGVDRGLFERLRALRGEIARERSVPAYIVFGDAVLRDLARIRPSTLDGLHPIKGIGQKKLVEFGQLFIDEINLFCQEHSLGQDQSPRSGSSMMMTTDYAEPVKSKPAAMLQAGELFHAGASVSDVAKQLDRAESTVQGYLVEYLVDQNVTDPTPWCSPEKAELIGKAWPESESGRLKPIFEAIEGKASYDEIRVVVTCLQNQQRSEPAED